MTGARACGRKPELLTLDHLSTQTASATWAGSPRRPRWAARRDHMNDNRGSNRNGQVEVAQEEIMWVQLLVERAKGLEEALSKMDGHTQAASLRELFRQADMVCGIYPDTASPAGYRYLIMKDPPKALMERYLSDGTPFVFGAVFRDGQIDAEFMKGIYDMGVENRTNKLVQEYCSAMWLNMAPASRAARARDAGAVDR